MPSSFLPEQFTQHIDPEQATNDDVESLLDAQSPKVMDGIQRKNVKKTKEILHQKYKTADTATALTTKTTDPESTLDTHNTASSSNLDSSDLLDVPAATRKESDTQTPKDTTAHASDKQSINPDYAYIVRRFRRWIKDYTLGMLLQPWIWALGYVFFTGAFIIVLWIRDPATLITQRNDLPNGMSLFVTWFISLIAILINYSFSFVTRFKTPRLSPILFLISLNILLVLFISLIPFFLAYFRS